MAFPMIFPKEVLQELSTLNPNYSLEDMQKLNKILAMIQLVNPQAIQKLANMDGSNLPPEDRASINALNKELDKLDKPGFEDDKQKLEKILNAIKQSKINTEKEPEVVVKEPEVIVKKQCAVCKKEKGENGGVLEKCSRCQDRLYCSKTCQTRDWPSHKLVCQIKKY